MVSNAKVRGLTTIPASLSYQVVTGELRDALGFKGLIVTDSPSAKAITDPPPCPFQFRKPPWRPWRPWRPAMTWCCSI